MLFVVPVPCAVEERHSKKIYPSSIFIKNLKGTCYLGFLKFQENRILYREIDFVDKNDKSDIVV